jgi:hypothetical protein
MIKYFGEIQVLDDEPQDEFKFSMKNITLKNPIGNMIRWSAMCDISTITIDPKTIDVKVNTSARATEDIHSALSFLIFKKDFLEKSDLKMIELSLDSKNDTISFKYVMVEELKLLNKETKENIPTDNIILYNNAPLFLLGPGKQVSLTCGFEKKSKRETNSIHQSASIGYIESLDNKEINFTAILQSDMTPKNLINTSFQRIEDRLTDMKKVIEQKNSDSFFIELNKNNRYNFIFLDQPEQIGNLIEKWNNRFDNDSITGYHMTNDDKGLNIEYGIKKFIPEVIEKDVSSKDILEKSLQKINPEKEKKQREETIKLFIINLDRILKYIIELRQDWDKVKSKTISKKDWLKMVYEERVSRSTRM